MHLFFQSLFRVTFFLGSLLIMLQAVAQQPEQTRTIRVMRTLEKIDLDGELNEATWSRAQASGDWSQYFPEDTSLAEYPTVLWMAYDDRFLYVAYRAQSSGNTFSATSLKRDFGGRNNDAVSLMFDPFMDRNNAQLFSVSPYNVQREALVSGGGVDFAGFSTSWDNKWYSGAKKYEDYYIAELAIPFKTMRYPKGSDRWFFNAYRLDAQTNEVSTWSRIPRQQRLFNLSFSGEMIFEEALPSPGANISLIPYVAGAASRDFEGGGKTESGVTIGGDAKIAVTPGLNLDLTVLPDFSQVEVDVQVTNLDRFEIFFPERRQFFLENADLFADFGSREARPFFTRRIGLGRDSTGNGIPIGIPFGVRLSGKVTQNLRIGLLNMTTAKNEAAAEPLLNYTAAVMQQKLWANSNIAAIFVNKQAIQDSTGDLVFNDPRFNRIAGIDFNPATKDNVWRGRIYYHQSFSPGLSENGVADTSSFVARGSHGVQLRYNTRNWDINWFHAYVGKDYNAEVGFVRRTGIWRIGPEARYYLYPDGKKVNRHGPGARASVVWTQGFGKTDQEINFNYRVEFQSTASITAGVFQTYTFLFSEFDPSGQDSVYLPVNSDYYQNRAFFFLRSDSRKLFNAQGSISHGGYYNGNRFQLQGSVNYRFQPFVNIGIGFDYNRVRLPEPYLDNDIVLIGPRIEVTLNRSVFFTLFTQYNSQVNNININGRLQWRFAPASDLFIVYTDNYTADKLGRRNRGIVVKLTYWLNI